MAPPLPQHKAGNVQLTEEEVPSTNKENHAKTGPIEKIPKVQLSRVRRAFDRIEVWLVGNKGDSFPSGPEDREDAGPEDREDAGPEDREDGQKSAPKNKRLYDTPWPPVMKRPPPNKPQNGWLRVLELSGHGDSRPVPPGMDGQAERPETPEKTDGKTKPAAAAEPVSLPSRVPGVPGSSEEEASEGSGPMEKRDLEGMQRAAKEVEIGEKRRPAEGVNPFVEIGGRGGHHTESQHNSDHHTKTHHTKTHTKTHHSKTKTHHTKPHHTKSHTSHHSKHHKTTTADPTSTTAPGTPPPTEPTPPATPTPDKHDNIELHHLPDSNQDLFFADSNHPAILNSASPGSSSAELLAEGLKSGSVEDAHHGSKLKHNGDKQDTTKHKLSKGYEIKHHNNKRAPPPAQPSRSRAAGAAAGKPVATRTPGHPSHSPHDMTVKEEEEKWKAGFDRSTSSRDRAAAKQRIEKLAAELEREREAGRERAEEAAERLARAAAGTEEEGKDYLDHDSYDPADAHVSEEVNRFLDGAAEEEGRRDAAALASTGKYGQFPSYQSLREASGLRYDSVRGQYLALHTASGEPSDLGLLLTIFMWVVLVVLILRCQRGRSEGVRWQGQTGRGGVEDLGPEEGEEGSVEWGEGEGWGGGRRGGEIGGLACWVDGVRWEKEELRVGRRGKRGVVATRALQGCQIWDHSLCVVVRDRALKK